MTSLIAILIHAVEAHHDKSVIADVGSCAQSVHNRKWHFWDTVQWAILYLILWQQTGNIIWLFSGLIARMFMLQVYLNHIRSMRASHLGKNWVDLTMKRWLGYEGTLVLKWTLMVMLIVVELSILIGQCK